MAKIGLVAALDFSDVAEDEFHDWYDHEHLPERQGIPGFLTCERWIGAENPKISLGSYDIENAGVLDSAPYRAISGANVSPWNRRVIGKCKRLFRIISDQVFPGDALAPAGAGGLLLSALNIAPELEAEFNEWFDAEHIPALAAVPGVLSARRFIASEGGLRHLALYHLTAPEVPAGAAWAQALQTPWRERIVPHYRDRVRLLCRRYVRAA